jgi:hypothetical protein
VLTEGSVEAASVLGPGGGVGVGVGGAEERVDDCGAEAVLDGVGSKVSEAATVAVATTPGADSDCACCWDGVDVLGGGVKCGTFCSTRRT